MRKISSAMRWPIAGIVFIIISIPFMLMLVPPNSLSGFRVHKTFTDEKIWYKANQMMGYDLLIAGILIAIAGFTIENIYRGNPQKSNRINFIIFTASLIGALLHSFWYLDQL